MRYRVLGTIGLETDDGRPVEIGSDRQRALIAALLARPGAIVSSDLLAELLWGEEQPANPTNSLQVLVSRLRTATRSAGEEFTDLRTAPGGYILEHREGAVDGMAFASMVRSKDEVEDPGRRAATLERALGMWAGPAFAEHAHTDVARLAAIELEETRLDAIEQLGSALLESGRSDEAVARMESFVAEHPLREGARETLMRALYEAGRHAEAIRTFAAYRSVLAEELGLEPSMRLQRLEEDILRHDMAESHASRLDERHGLDRMTVRYLDHRGPIAHATVGKGARLVVAPAWVTSLDVIRAGRDPRSSVLERLVGVCELTLYDRLGSGLSRSEVEDFSIEAAASELEAVMEATGGPGAVMAVSQAGPTVLTLAARRPDLVTRLVLAGTYASGPAVFTNPALTSAVSDVLRNHWGLGSQLVAGMYRPSLSDGAVDHLARVLRDSAPKEVALGYLEGMYEADVSGLLPTIETPALVLHYRGDRVIPFAGGMQLATGLPNAEMVPMEGGFHLPDVGDLDLIVGTIAAFLGSEPA